jgi:hypothetical protein
VSPSKLVATARLCGGLPHVSLAYQPYRCSSSKVFDVDFIDDNEPKTSRISKRPELAALLRYDDLSEWIFVPNSDDGGHCYQEFHQREELLLHVLIWMKSGSTHTFMGVTVTQGDSRRWLH